MADISGPSPSPSSSSAAATSSANTTSIVPSPSIPMPMSMAMTGSPNKTLPGGNTSNASGNSGGNSGGSRRATRDDLVHPMPQRRYAFIINHDRPSYLSATPSASSSSTSSSSGAATAGPYGPDPYGLVARPVSAPAGLHPDLQSLERPNSPFSRGTNPMVRDHHFRRVGGVGGMGGVGMGVSTPPGGNSSSSNSDYFCQLPHVQRSQRVTCINNTLSNQHHAFNP